MGKSARQSSSADVKYRLRVTRTVESQAEDGDTRDRAACDIRPDVVTCSATTNFPTVRTVSHVVTPRCCRKRAGCDGRSFLLRSQVSPQNKSHAVPVAPRRRRRRRARARAIRRRADGDPSELGAWPRVDARRAYPAHASRATRQDYRLFLKSGDNVVSAWHDVPLFSSTAGALNFVCEIPKETKAKARFFAAARRRARPRQR